MTDVKAIQDKRILCEFSASGTNVIGAILSISAALTSWITSGQTFMPTSVGGFDYKTFLASMSLTQVCGPKPGGDYVYFCGDLTTTTLLVGTRACFFIGFIFGMLNGFKYIMQGMKCSAFLCSSTWCTYTQVILAFVATAFTLAGTCVAIGNVPSIFLNSVHSGMSPFWGPGFGLSIAATVFQFIALGLSILALTIKEEVKKPFSGVTTLPTYLSVNLDTGSLYNNFSFSNPVFQQLVRNLALLSPTQFRIGGGAADNTAFTGEGGASGSCPGVYPGIDICVSAQDWDDIMSFVAATGVELVWDLNAAFYRVTAQDAWNSTNAQLLFQHASLAASRGLPVPTAYQLGNEPEDWYKRHPPLNISGATLAQDYHTLRTLLASFPALSTSKIMGPDACCEDRYPLISDFTGKVTGSLDAVTVHAYPLPRFPNSSCCCWPPYYTNKSAMLGVATAIQGYQALAAPILALGVPLVLGETATSAHGGCDGLSNRFIAGFTFMLELGTLGELGVSQVNRQDIAGFSSETGPSSYALLGPPGWSGPGLITPHPDYWVAVLWKQLVGRSVLASSGSSSSSSSSSGGGGGAPLDPTLDIHVWCAAPSGGSTGSGSVVVTWFNMGTEAVTLQLPPGLPTTPRVEYTLSSPAGNLTSDQVLLNGAWLVTRADGTIPEFPLPGNEVAPGGGEPSLEPSSYGFFVFTGFSAPACVCGGA